MTSGRRDENGFVWWSYALAQQVTVAGTLTAPDGAAGTRLVVSTDVVRNVEDAQAAVDLVCAADRYASMSALLWDEDDRSIRESFSVVVYPDLVPFWSQPLSLAAILQNIAAHTPVSIWPRRFEVSRPPAPTPPRASVRIPMTC